MSAKGKMLRMLEILSPVLPAGLFLRAEYRLLMERKLHLCKPVTYNEKLQWLKCHDHNPLYHKLVDKAEVKPVVASLAGADCVIPTLGVWNSFDEIDFGSLPQRFVLKCTHDSGSVVVCRDKDSFDAEAARAKLAPALRRNYYQQSKEWPYKGLKGRIIAEEYLDALDGDVADYKFFCFNGVPKFLFVATERMKEGAETKFDFFDMDWNHLPFTQGHPNASVCPRKPAGFEQMAQLAAKLSVGIPHVRIDLYNVGGKVLFGEYTFTHWRGMMPFRPEEWDYEFGRLLELPR